MVKLNQIYGFVQPNVVSGSSLIIAKVIVISSHKFQTLLATPHPLSTYLESTLSPKFEQLLLSNFTAKIFNLSPISRLTIFASGIRALGSEVFNTFNQLQYQYLFSALFISARQCGSGEALDPVKLGNQIRAFGNLRINFSKMRIFYFSI